MSKKPNFKSYDVADYINSPEDVVAYLDAAFEDGDPAVIAAMIGAVARSKGMSAIAEQTGRSRESLYRALSAEGNPTLSILVEVLKALGLRLSVVTEPALRSPTACQRQPGAFCHGNS